MVSEGATKALSEGTATCAKSGATKKFRRSSEAQSRQGAMLPDEPNAHDLSRGQSLKVECSREGNRVYQSDPCAHRCPVLYVTEDCAKLGSDDPARRNHRFTQQKSALDERNGLLPKWSKTAEQPQLSLAGPYGLYVVPERSSSIRADHCGKHRVHLA